MEDHAWYQNEQLPLFLLIDVLMWKPGADGCCWPSWLQMNCLISYFFSLDTIILMKPFPNLLDKIKRIQIKAVCLKFLRVLKTAQTKEIFNSRQCYSLNTATNTFETKEKTFYIPMQKQMQHSWTEIDVCLIYSVSSAGCVLEGMGNTMTCWVNIPMIVIPLLAELWTSLSGGCSSKAQRQE